MLDQERLAQANKIRLGKGKHVSWRQGACLMEAISFVAGEPWSDYPQCVCPTLAGFLRQWNDGLPDEQRTQLLRPLIPLLIGTCNPEYRIKRNNLIKTWMIDEHTVPWLRAAGLSCQADQIAAEQTYKVHNMLSEAARDLSTKLHDDGCDREWRRFEQAWRAAERATRASGSPAPGGRRPWTLRSPTNTYAAAWIAWCALRGGVPDMLDEVLRPTVEQIQASAIAMIHRAVALQDEVL